jgi:hypothetical protein
VDDTPEIMMFFEVAKFQRAIIQSSLIRAYFTDFLETYYNFLHQM